MGKKKKRAREAAKRAAVLSEEKSTSGDSAPSQGGDGTNTTSATKESSDHDVKCADVEEHSRVADQHIPPRQESTNLGASGYNPTAAKHGGQAGERSYAATVQSFPTSPPDSLLPQSVCGPPLASKITTGDQSNFLPLRSDPESDTKESSMVAVDLSSPGASPAASSVTTSYQKKSFKIQPFRRMIRDLEKCLSNGDALELAQLTGQSPDISIKIADMEKPFQYLMANLEKQGIVSESDVDALLELFDEIDADDATELVQRYQSSLANNDTAESPIAHDDKCAPSNTVTLGHPSHADTKPRARETTQTRHSADGTRRVYQNEGITNCWEDMATSLESLSIGVKGDKDFTVIDSMTLDIVHLSDDNVSRKNVLVAFLSHLMSYDYRCLRLFKRFECNLPSPVGPLHNLSRSYNREHKLSCRDIIHAIIRSCDPFLRQDVLSKLSACQLAVPIMSTGATDQSVMFFLWGIQKISKAWQNPKTGTVHEESVSTFPFPVVTALKFGDPECSKSNVLNKMLGSIQGNDDHPYFVSSEQESKKSVLSHGTVEAVWYLPGCTRSEYTLNQALCVLNLRGNALNLPQQLDFICDYTSVVVLFVTKTEIIPNWGHLDKLARKGKLIVVMCAKSGARSKREDNQLEVPVRALGASVIDCHGQATVDICESICSQINRSLSQSTDKVAQSLVHMKASCEARGIDVDMDSQECTQARTSAESIIEKCRTHPEEYKRQALPLQSEWQKWSHLDKDRSWKGAQGNVERELAKLHEAKENQRKRQREIGMSKVMKMLYDELKNPSVAYRQYLVFWLHHGLNEISSSHLRPLAEDLKTTRDCLREHGAEITSLQRKLNDASLPKSGKSAIQSMIVKTTEKEGKLQATLAEKTKIFDSSSLGFEHFVREFGQIYESSHNIHQQRHIQRFDTGLLPRMAAEMLLSGYPLEIFDGDTCHVPIKWVKGVLAAVRSIVGNVSIYVISVIGIQSSGKSTLLNSMFGVRFAVSAGRCTRGVFLQLLPIAENLKGQLGCDYVAVIDTEGLKAPEKAVAERKSDDNELATFALCLSDMTLINIGGQTVGEDLSNILQISAHAFIRMKEVHLRSSCYLIQQFVADVTAQYRNQTSTQSILQKLDQAVLTAAIEEKKEDQYRQFSDCFNIVNIDSKKESVQYIPSLWRGPMSSPNHVYSETVAKLKAALLREIQESPQVHKITEFAERIASVWEAVKQEDFVFNFRNTTEIAQYSRFSQMFKKQQLTLTQAMMNWELTAKQVIRNTAAENIQARQETLFRELEAKLTSEFDQIKTSLEEMLMRRELESVRQHSVFFYRELDMVETNTRDTIKNVIRMESAIITNATVKETQLLPQLKAKLRREVLPVAERLKDQLVNCSSKSSESVETQNEPTVRATFEEEWRKYMESIQQTNPLASEAEITERIRTDMVRCVMETLRNTSVSKEMKEFMSTRNLFELCQYTPTIRSLSEISRAHKLIGNCTREISTIIRELERCVEAAINNPKFRLSVTFFNSISDFFKAVLGAECQGCRDKKMLLLCLASYVVQRANESHKDNILNQLMENNKLLQTLKEDETCTKWKIKRDVKQCLKESTTRSLSNGIFETLKHFEDKVLAMFSTMGNSNENYQNQIRRNLNEIISKRGITKWYSTQVTRDFINMANEVIEKQREYDMKKRERLLSEACTIFIHEAIQSEKRALAETVSWETVEKLLEIEPVSPRDQMKRLTEVLHDILPEAVRAALLELPEVAIVKYSRMAVSDDVRHSLDECLLSELPVHDSDHSHAVLSIIHETRRLFLGFIQDSGTYNSNLFRTVINTLHQELGKRRGLSEIEHVVCIAHICSWVLRICVDLQVTSERENSVQVLLEEEKELLYGDFKSLCNGRCQDHLAAKSLCAIFHESFRVVLRNRICTALFDRLLKAEDEIFCSRPRFLQVVLKQICEEEQFRNYAGFLCNHSLFIRKWVLNFIAEKCCTAENNNINLEDIVLHEIDEIIRETEESFEATLRVVQNTDEEIPFEVWVQNFTEHLENHRNASLNEERISEICMYAVVSDYNVFIEECKVLLNESVRQQLLDDAEIPDTTSLDSMKEWIECLPKKLHVVLAESVQGCGTQCPFCKTLCDDTIKEHKVHFSNLHYPIGAGGWRFRHSRKLDTSTCVANVASNRKYYSCHCRENVCKHEPTPFKNYKQDYPDWDIRPITDYEATLYWKWVLSRFNADFARYYNCKPADIPWGVVTKQEALQSIQNMV